LAIAAWSKANNGWEEEQFLVSRSPNAEENREALTASISSSLMLAA